MLGHDTGEMRSKGYGERHADTELPDPRLAFVQWVGLALHWARSLCTGTREAEVLYISYHPPSHDFDNQHSTLVDRRLYTTQQTTQDEARCALHGHRGRPRLCPDVSLLLTRTTPDIRKGAKREETRLMVVSPSACSLVPPRPRQLRAAHLSESSPLRRSSGKARVDS